MTDDLPELMTVREAAKYLRCHTSTIYRLIKADNLPGAFRVGSDYRINRNVLDKALRQEALKK